MVSPLARIAAPGEMELLMPMTGLVLSKRGLVVLVPVAAVALLITSALVLDAAGLADLTEGSTDRASAPTSTVVPTRSPTGTPDAGTALAATQLLTVKGRAPRTGYDRDEFGQRWADTDRNGCDQRNDVLRRDLHHVVTRAGSKGCVVLSGTLADPFTGKTIEFSRGNTTSTAVHVDHVVALSDAWQKGAQQWDAEKRKEFANDFLNLVAVDGPTNMSKGDGDTATWLPPNKEYRCAYVARQVSVKRDYELWVTPAELEAMIRVLSTCPETEVLTSGRVDPPERDSSTGKTSRPSTPGQGIT